MLWSFIKFSYLVIKGMYKDEHGELYVDTGAWRVKRNGPHPLWGIYINPVIQQKRAACCVYSSQIYHCQKIIYCQESQKHLRTISSSLLCTWRRGLTMHPRLLLSFLYDTTNKRNLKKMELTWHFLQPFEFSSSLRTVNVSINKTN